MEKITLGFLGTGTISAAIVRGLCQQNSHYQIIVSPRNQEIAQQLQADFPKQVRIAENNQTVLDQANIIFIALRMQIAEAVIRELNFHENHKIVTLIATASQAMIADWTNHVAPIYRAVPLPFVEKQSGVTPIYPADHQLEAIFQQLGGCVVVEDENRFNLFMIAGSFMGVYFHILENCNQWLKEQGLSQEQTAPFLAQLFSNLSQEAQKNHDFPALEQEYSTKGGTNELISKAFTSNGGDKALSDAFNSALERMRHQ